MTTYIRKVVGATLVWISVLAFCVVAAQFKLLAIPYDTYVAVVWVGAIILVGLVFFGLVTASNYIGMSGATKPETAWYENPWLASLIIFWALFPPSYFFVEYYAIDKGLISLPEPLPDGIDSKARLLVATKTYSDLAAKIWAGASAILATVLAVSKRPTP